MQSEPQRRARGAQKLSEILGQTSDQVEQSLGDIAPQLATYVLETIYVEIYQNPSSTLAHGIVTVTALATLGTQHRNCEPTSAARCGAASRGKNSSRS